MEHHVYDQLFRAIEEAVGSGISHRQFRNLCDQAWLDYHRERAVTAEQEIREPWPTRR